MRTTTLLAAAACLTSSLLAQGALSAPCFVTNLGAPLGLGDDQVAANNALGFTFPGPGGTSVTSIDISSNGFVWLGSNASADCCNGDVTTFLTDTPRIAAMWTDLYPPGNGDVYFNTFPASGTQPASAVITWNDCPEIGTTDLQSIQLQLFADGSFVIAYDLRCGNLNHDALVGVTEGVAAVANPIDFAAITGGAPHLSGTNPTIHELLPFSWDLAGKSFAFVPNGSGGYIVLDRPSCAYADVRTLGAGCPQPLVAYELFQTPATIDLANTALEFIPTGGGYVTLPSTGFFTGYAGAQTFFDDEVKGPFALPFQFPFGGGLVNSIDISSNGFVWLSAGNADARCCNGDPATFLADPASIAPLWQDLNPFAGGTIYFDLDPNGVEAHVTWLNVPEYLTNNLNTAQLTLRSNGSFRFSYGNVVNQNHDLLVGVCQGAAQIDPGSSDFSAGPVVVNSGGIPLRLQAQANVRPVLGTTFAMDVDQITAGSLIGIMAFGATTFTPGLDISSIGMPGCQLYASLDALLSFPLTGSPTTYSFPVPSSPTLTGLVFYAQAATLTPGVNQLGLTASNGLELTLGL
ncbi:MAG: hypothetical protein MUC36_05085 [Planctomycetes bacterium]|jgi:hypothetical protein|nr:hypothetical protein [Planctomycetota bacterium]